MKSLLAQKNLGRDLFIICVGSLILAIGLDSFQIPNGLAAGGLTGLATVFHALAHAHGWYLPVGMQTLAMNAVLMVPVIRSGGVPYLVRTLAGIFFSSVFTDLLAPIVPVLGSSNLLLAALWGGVIAGVGLGIVFRTGGNTGGTDIIAQLLAKHTSLSMGSLVLAVDFFVILVSIPVFSIENALYATVSMFVASKVIDMTVDGPKSERAAYIISQKHDRIANAVMYEMGRGCTEIQARGVWSGNSRPMLLVVLGRSETTVLKNIVMEIDPEAIVFVTEVHEAFGEGFRRIDAS